MISAAENSNKFLKTRFWKEKSVEDVDEFILGPTALATLVNRECTEIIHIRSPTTDQHATN